MTADCFLKRAPASKAGDIRAWQGRLSVVLQASGANPGHTLHTNLQPAHRCLGHHSQTGINKPNQPPETSCEIKV